MIDLPPIEEGAGRFEADYYGAATLIARKLGLKNNTPPTSVDWMHGWCDKKIAEPAYLSPNSPPGRIILVDREINVENLRSRGFKNSFAVGVPFLYAEIPDRTPRIPESVLVMPPHNTTHSKNRNFENLEAFFRNIQSKTDKFSKVAICVSGSCAQDKEYMGFIHKFGYEVIVGAWIFDKNALIRMKMILSSFTAIVTNTIGSHIAYAASCGTRIIMANPLHMLDYRKLAETEPFYARFPNLIPILEEEERNHPPEKKFPILFQENQQQEVLRSWGHDELGNSFKRTPEEIAALFGWKLKSQFQALSKESPDSVIKKSLEMIEHGNAAEAIKQLSALKGIHDQEHLIDLARSKAFLKLGKIVDAFEAVKESLRFHPNSSESKTLFRIILQKMPPGNLPEDSEFREIYFKIRRYTMIWVDRLYSLYSNAKRICEEDLQGNFVECGVAAGGSSAMLAYVIKKYSKRERKLFCFDTFEGMPAAGEKDAAFGVKAEDTGWGKGTCAAPLECLKEAAEVFEAWDRIVAVKGLFADTLPKHKQAIGPIAFLHADGDWYESTMDIFNNLYESVVDHGFVQIDDYGYWQGCKQAIHEFEARCGVKFPLRVIDVTGVSFTKTLQQDHFVAQLMPSNWNFPRKALAAAPSPTFQQELKPRLNIGCGSQIHSEWTNLNIIPRHPGVINHDLNKRLPFADASFEVVYHSHVLEHLTKEQGKAFVAECYRVLKPGGILRVVVPDLETIARLYLENLDKAEAGDGTASNRHEWMLLELLDQMVRETSGGEMGRYFQLNPMPAEDFVIERFGHQVLEVIQPMRANPALRNRPVPPLPRQVDVVEAARFRQSGEIHKWMYDRRSLGRLLAESGFNQVAVKKAGESSIPEFGKYFLDRMPDGSTRKPDSLFMEAFKS